LETHLDSLVPIIRGQELSGILKESIVRLRIVAWRRQLGQQIGPWTREIKIPGRKSTRLDLLGDRPGVYVVSILHFMWRLIRNGLVAGRRLMRAVAICQHERVLGVRVLEIVVDALLLHEAGREIEVRLAILDAVFERLVGSTQRVLEVRKAVFSKNCLYDVDDGLALEDATIRGVRQERQPGT
jgi:hypothetical protein